MLRARKQIKSTKKTRLRRREEKRKGKRNVELEFLHYTFLPDQAALFPTGMTPTRFQIGTFVTYNMSHKYEA